MDRVSTILGIVNAAIAPMYTHVMNIHAIVFLAPAWSLSLEKEREREREEKEKKRRVKIRDK